MLILLAASRVQLCGDMDALLAEHQYLLAAPWSARAGPPRRSTRTRQGACRTVPAPDHPTTLLIRGNAPCSTGLESTEVSLEEIVSPT